jgi:hypothetical protein
MSTVKRYTADAQYPGQYSAREDVVNAYDYDAALAREAALREELAKQGDDYCKRVDEVISLQQRLAIAEQRVEELVGLLNRVIKTGELGCAHYAELEADICAALKPATEVKS